MKSDNLPLQIAVVGPCTAGKSTLTRRLRALGYATRAVSQEHSYVPDMWRRVARTDILIYLDVGIETIAQRRKIFWGQERLDDLNYRLRHARAHADFYLRTDDIPPEEVEAQVLAFLKEKGFLPQK